MNYIYLGKIVNTHGIKGEIRILSSFSHKEAAFLPKNFLYIGEDKQKKMILQYRVHKQYDMVLLEGIDSIDLALSFKGKDVFINRQDLIIDGILDEDLIGLVAKSNEEILGTVIEVEKGFLQDRLVLLKENRKIRVPYVEAFVKKIDLHKKEIEIEKIEGLL